MSIEMPLESASFFARFFKDVIGIDRGALVDTLGEVRQYMNSHLKYILIDSLAEVAERIRQEPRNIAHLVEGVTLYALMPANEFIPDILAMQVDPWLAPRYAQDSLRKRLKVIGLSIELPTVPSPPVVEESKGAL